MSEGYRHYFFAQQKNNCNLNKKSGLYTYVSHALYSDFWERGGLGEKTFFCRLKKGFLPQGLNLK